MTTSVGPVYFFDQPKRQRQKFKGKRTHLDLESLKQDGQTEPQYQSDVLRVLPGEAQEEDRPEITSSVFSLKEQDMMEAYRRTAPQLLSELAHVLSQHKWSAEGRVPHGLVNILHYTWQELTAGARLLPALQHTEKHRKPWVSSNRDSPRPLSSNQRQERETAPCQVKQQVSSNVQVKKRKSRSCKDLSPTSLSFSILNQSSRCQEWITQQQDISCTEDVHIYTWALERLQGSRSPVTAQSRLNRPIILRHYGDHQRQKESESGRTAARLGTFWNGLPQIPDTQPLAPQNRQKLHYRSNDGSSVIYYPSGSMAVCQSCSAQPYRGFYTNVFSDCEPPVIIATITASGHGTVMHPHSSSISAVWDQEGGLFFDLKGHIIKEWSWSSGLKNRRIVIKVTEVIYLDIYSGTSVILNFTCNSEHVQLSLSVLSNTTKRMSYLQTNTQFTSDTAQDLLGASFPGHSTDSRAQTRVSMSVCSRDGPQIVREVRQLQDGPSLWRREGRPIRELRKIQQRIQSTLNEWMDFYCIAIGIKCPDMQRMPDVPPRSRLKREVQLAALPSLNSPERTDAELLPPPDHAGQRRHLSVPGPKKHDSALKLSSPLKKRTKEDSLITRIGPVQIYGNMKPESVILPMDPDQRVTCFTHPSQLPLCPFPLPVPLTHCPVLLRAALNGDGWPRRCRCSPLTMPAVTDLEYDFFVLGQPTHSHQMLIVCVTCPNLCPRDSNGDALEQLYRRRNKHRRAPCTQCQVDSFRLVSYEVSTPKPCFEAEKALLQQRHNAAPGMVLMYIKGKLLFVGFIEYSDQHCPVKDIEKYISKARGDYRSGLYHPPDFKFSGRIDSVPNKHTDESKNNEEIEMSLVKVKGPEVTRPQSRKESCSKLKKTRSTTRPTQSLGQMQ